jgi:hypothetical protein
MSLKYRGIPYEQNFIPLEMQEGDIGGKYRGQDWKYHYPRHIPQLEPKLYLQYRGVSYSSRPTVVREGMELPTLACSLPLSQLTPIESDPLSAVHLDNIRRRLERRLQSAQEKGDQTLIALLKKESRDLALPV